MQGFILISCKARYYGWREEGKKKKNYMHQWKSCRIVQLTHACKASNKIKVEEIGRVDMSGEGKQLVLYTSILLSLTWNIWKELNDKGVSI